MKKRSARCVCSEYIFMYVLCMGGGVTTYIIIKISKDSILSELCITVHHSTAFYEPLALCYDN